MSHIQSSRMPHVYAEPSASNDHDGVRDIARKIGERAEDVPTLGWLLGAVGAGIVGAGLYAAFAGSTPKKKSATRGSGRGAAKPSTRGRTPKAKTATA